MADYEDEGCDTCPRAAVHEVEFRMVNGKLQDLKERVARLETTMGRGVLLLVANLVGVVMTLAQRYFQS